jgi:hypothetical protein
MLALKIMDVGCKDCTKQNYANCAKFEGGHVEAGGASSNH